MASVSICIPTYNQSAYLERSVLSAYNQTHKPSEIIVCDDCSTDDTKEVLDRLKKQIPMLNVFHQPVNQGISKNVEACLRMATGDLILRLDSDDILFPEYVDKVSELMNQFPEAGYGHVAIQEIDQNDKQLKVRRLFRRAVYSTADEALRAAAKGYKVAANIVMFRKSALEKVGYMTTNVNFAEDYYLSVRIAASGFGNVYLNEVLASYRVWTDMAKVRQRRKLDEIKGIHGVFKDALEPAYLERNWDQTELAERRSELAVGQADSLGWDVYSIAEKKEIAALLLQLSPSQKVQNMIWLYGHGFGPAVSIISKVLVAPKFLAKKLITGINHIIKARN